MMLSREKCEQGWDTREDEHLLEDVRGIKQSYSYSKKQNPNAFCRGERIPSSFWQSCLGHV